MDYLKTLIAVIVVIVVGYIRLKNYRTKFNENVAASLSNNDKRHRLPEYRSFIKKLIIISLVIVLPFLFWDYSNRSVSQPNHCVKPYDGNYDVFNLTQKTAYEVCYNEMNHLIFKDATKAIRQYKRDYPGEIGKISRSYGEIYLTPSALTDYQFCCSILKDDFPRFLRFIELYQNSYSYRPPISKLDNGAEIRIYAVDPASYYDTDDDAYAGLNEYEFLARIWYSVDNYGLPALIVPVFQIIDEEGIPAPTVKYANYPATQRIDCSTMNCSDLYTVYKLDSRKKYYYKFNQIDNPIEFRTKHYSQRDNAW